MLYTNSDDECYQLAMVAVCLQHLTVAPSTTRESRSNS